MLAEGFLRVLRYREERKFGAKLKRSQTCMQVTDPSNCQFFNSDVTNRLTESAETASLQGELDSSHFQGLAAGAHGPATLSIPGCPHPLPLNPDFNNLLDDCSLLKQYPDLQVVDSSAISCNPMRVSIEDSFVSEDFSQPEWSAQPQPQGETISVIPDQEYLAMGASVSVSLDLAGPQLEPMSNSVLNGLLDKQLNEVYMQLLTDNLARCNSQMGNSLLHGLGPPPQPSCQLKGPDSLEASMEEASRAESGKKISYLRTHNLGPCSSNFSSPVLRISEADNTHPQLTVQQPVCAVHTILNE